MSARPYLSRGAWGVLRRIQSVEAAGPQVRGVRDPGVGLADLLWARRDPAKQVERVRELRDAGLVEVRRRDVARATVRLTERGRAL